MIISAIKYRIEGEASAKAWRFPSATGKRRNFVCHYAPRAELEEFYEALRFALRGDPNARVLAAALHVIDPAGDAWIVERRRGECRYFRNGKELNADAEATFLAAIADHGFEPDADTRAALGTLVKSFEITVDNDKLIAFGHGKGQDQFGVKRVADQQIAQLVERCGKFLGSVKLADPKIIASLVKQTESDYAAWQELTNQKEALLTESGKLSAIDPDVIPKLEAELALIDEIRVAATPFLDPASAPQIVRDKLTQVENDLRTLCQKHAITTLPLAEEDADWEKLLHVLSRLQAYEKLAEATERARQTLERDVEPVFSAYVATVEGLLENDTQITAELESCLSTLTIQMRRSQEAAARTERGGLQKALERLLPQTEKSGDGSHAQVDSGRNEGLEQARMAVDYALGRLGELHSSVESAKDGHASSLAKIQDFHERVAGEYRKLSANWRTLAERYKVPVTFNLKALVSLIQNHGQIANLWRSRERLREQIAHYRSQLATLEKLIANWRTATGSQKETPLDNASILLAEARGILQYRTKKQQQLEKLRNLQVKISAYHQLGQYLDTRLAAIKSSWAKTFHQLALPLVSIQQKDWPEFFQAAHKLAALSGIVMDCQKPLAGEAIFSEDALDRPLTVYFWHHEVTLGRNRLLLLQQVEAAATTGFGLLLVADPILADMIAKLDLPLALPIEGKPKAQPEPAPRAAPSPTPRPTPVLRQKVGPRPEREVEATVLSERAKAALEVLTTKPGQKTLGGIKP